MSGETISSYALLTLDEVRDTLGIKSHDQNDTLIKLINAVTSFVEGARGINHRVLSRTATERWNGDGGVEYILKDGYNITAMSGVTYGLLSDKTTDKDVPAGSFKYDEIGTIYLLDNYAFEEGVQNCSCSFTAGYSAVPDDIAYAARRLVKYLWKPDEHNLLHVTSISHEGQNATFRIDDIPAEVERIFQAYRGYTFA